MDFLKNFFDDESKIIGLCGFKTLKPKYSESTVSSEKLYTYFENAQTINALFSTPFETNFAKNALLL